MNSIEFRNKTILITGVAGFIGSHVCEKLLKSGCSIIGLDNFDSFYDIALKEINVDINRQSESFKLVRGDLINIDRLINTETKIDAVIHLAAKAGVLPSIKEPREYIKSNILGTQAVLDFMNNRKIKKIIFASSSSIYGNNETPFSETDIVDYPISPYAASKKAGELLLHTYHHLYNFNVVCLRFFTVYGPRQRPDLAIHKFTRLIHEQKMITMYGDGSTARDYTYIDDTVRGIVLSLRYLFGNKRVYEIINLGNSNPVTLLNLIYLIYDSFGKTPQINEIEMQPGDVKITYAKVEKAKIILGYQPSISIEDGIKLFKDWFVTTVR